MRINTDEFTHQYALSFSPGKGAPACSIRLGRKMVLLEDVQAVWVRKWAQPTPHVMASEEQSQSAAAESRAALEGFFAAIRHTPSIDPIDRIIAGENKQLQLQLAANAGLSIPNTLVSNDTAAIRAFLKSCKGGAIAKMQTTLSWGMEGSDNFFYTTRIDARQLTGMPAMLPHPMIFQEEVRKEYELRVAYVDGQCFCGKIPGSVFQYDPDWRKPGITFHWEQVTLPKPIVTKIRKVMQGLGLRFGAIDIIKSTDGPYYFLEVNPTGEWGMLEKHLGLPISKAIADALIGVSTTRH